MLHNQKVHFLGKKTKLIGIDRRVKLYSGKYKQTLEDKLAWAPQVLTAIHKNRSFTSKHYAVSNYTLLYFIELLYKP